MERSRRTPAKPAKRLGRIPAKPSAVTTTRTTTAARTTTSTTSAATTTTSVTTTTSTTGSGPAGGYGGRVGLVVSHDLIYALESELEAQFAQIRAGGVNWVREDFAWQVIEPRPGCLIGGTLTA